MRTLTSLLILTTILWLFTSCQTTDTDDSIISEESLQLVTTRLHLDFTTTESDWTRATIPDGSPSAITRASAAESAVSRIALTILDVQGNKVIEKNQRKTDTDFGTFSDLRLAPGTYTLVIVAHKAASTEDGFATITTATSATLPGDYLLDTYTTTTEVTITPATDQDFTLTVPLCVSKLTLTTLDKVPSDVSQVRITINPDADPLTSLTFNPTTGLIASPASFTRTWDVTPAAGKQTGTFHLYIMAKEYPLTTDVKVETLDSEGTPISTRTYNDITFNRAKVRTLNTNLFTGTASGTLTFEEWTSEDPITIE